jgi:hypothetical protein
MPRQGHPEPQQPPNSIKETHMIESGPTQGRVTHIFILLKK